MEWLAIPLVVLALGITWWLTGGGPQAVARERRLGREADAKAEEARTERARIERSRDRA